MLYKKGVTKTCAKFIGKYVCESLFFNKVIALSPATLFKKETSTQEFSCEVREIYKNTFFYKTPLLADSVWFFCFSKIALLRARILNTIKTSAGSST